MLIQGFFYTKSVSIVMLSALVCVKHHACVSELKALEREALYIGDFFPTEDIYARERERDGLLN